MKKKNIILLGTAIILLIGGSVLGLNSYFGAGGKIPEDTFTRGLVAYWSFDEGTGNTVYDLSGNGNHGTIHGATWTQGKFGKALSFDGVDDYVDCGNDESLNITDEITIEAWVKRAGDFPTNNIGNIVWRHNYGARTGYRLFAYTNGRVRFAVGNGSNIYYAGTGYPLSTIGEWVHVVGVFDGSYVKLYINGQFNDEVQFSGSFVEADCNLLISQGAETFNGTIDEVRIYNRALSEEEIRYHYNHGRPLAHWRFDEGSGTTIYDSSGHGYHGILHE